MGITPLLVAAAVKVALPAFEVERGPGVLSQLGPAAYATSFESLQCASGLVTTRLGPDVNTTFVNCDGDPVCLANIGKQMGVQFVLTGRLNRLADETLATDLRLVDVRVQAVTRRFLHKFKGNLNGYEFSVKEFAPAVCKAINPEWKEQKTPEQLLADLQFDLSGLTPAPSEPEAAKPAPPVVTPPPAVTPPPVVTAQTEAPVVKPEPRPVIQDVKLTPTSSTGVLGFLQPPRSSKARIASFATLGAAAAGTVVGSVLGGTALSAAGNRGGASDLAAFNQAQATAESRALGANVAFSLAGTAAITAAVFWLAGDRIFSDAAPLAQTTAP